MNTTLRAALFSTVPGGDVEGEAGGELCTLVTTNQPTSDTGDNETKK